MLMTGVSIKRKILMNIGEPGQNDGWVTLLAMLGGKTGAGKTTIMAHLLDKLERIPTAVQAFNFESAAGTGLERYHQPTEPVKLAAQSDLDNLVNGLAGLDTERPLTVLMDFPADFDDAFLFRVLDVPWAQLQELKIRFVLALVLSDDADSLAMLFPWMSQLGDHVSYCAILNEGQGKDFFNYTRSPRGVAFVAQHQPLELRFPKIPAAIMLPLTDAGSTLYRAFDEETGAATAAGLSDDLLTREQVWQLRDQVDASLQPLVNLLTGQPAGAPLLGW
jgi:hypothetical protein